MKTLTARSTTNTNSNTSRPFFNKSGQGSFFSSSPEPKQAFFSSTPEIQRSPSSSSNSSSGNDSGGERPAPVRNEDGSCQCRLDICYRPIDLWYVPSHFKHGFINIIDSSCQHHNLYVDPSQHGGHSHAVDNVGGWDTSGENCVSREDFPCSLVDKLPASVAKYEALNVSYDATGGPNSNAFLEWIMYDAFGAHIPSPHPGLVAWNYYEENPQHRSSPPTQAGNPATPTP